MRMCFPHQGCPTSGTGVWTKDQGSPLSTFLLPAMGLLWFFVGMLLSPCTVVQTSDILLALHLCAALWQVPAVSVFAAFLVASHLLIYVFILSSSVWLIIFWWCSSSLNWILHFLYILFKKENIQGYGFPIESIWTASCMFLYEVFSIIAFFEVGNFRFIYILVKDCFVSFIVISK